MVQFSQTGIPEQSKAQLLAGTRMDPNDLFQIADGDARQACSVKTQFVAQQEASIAIDKDREMGCEYLARDHAAEQCKATLPNINASNKRLMFQSIRLGAMELQGVARAKEATQKPMEI
jgi:hypothetical protein